MRGLSCIFPCNDIKKTANFFEEKLGFRIVLQLDVEHPHV